MAKECNANCASAAFERQGQADASAHRRKRIPANRHAPLQFDLASVSNVTVPRATRTRTVLDDIERLAALLDGQNRRAVPIGHYEAAAAGVDHAAARRSDANVARASVKGCK